MGPPRHPPTSRAAIGMPSDGAQRQESAPGVFADATRFTRGQPARANDPLPRDGHPNGAGELSDYQRNSIACRDRRGGQPSVDRMGRRRHRRCRRRFARAADEGHQQQSGHQHRRADQPGQPMCVRRGSIGVCHASLSVTAGHPARRFGVHHGSTALHSANRIAASTIRGDQ